MATLLIILNMLVGIAGMSYFDAPAWAILGFVATVVTIGNRRL